MTKSHRWRVLKRGTYLKVLVCAIVLLCIVFPVQAAIADFDGTPTQGSVPLIVSFLDNSSGTIKSRLWDFGDGFGSFLKNPTHMFLFAGEFDVGLTIFNATDETANITKEKYINVTYPEIPVFDDTDPSQAPGALTVNKFFAETDPGTGEFLAEFTAFPTVLGDNPEFTWDFDDGSPDEVTDVPEITHSYGPGIYEPEVTVHSDGMTDYELHLPTYLIVISPGMNIDDLIEEEVEV
jgi:PKD repeat protein